MGDHCCRDICFDEHEFRRGGHGGYGGGHGGYGGGHGGGGYGGGHAGYGGGHGGGHGGGYGGGHGGFRSSGHHWGSWKKDDRWRIYVLFSFQLINYFNNMFIFSVRIPSFSFCNFLNQKNYKYM